MLGKKKKTQITKGTSPQNRFVEVPIKFQSLKMFGIWNCWHSCCEMECPCLWLQLSYSLDTLKKRFSAKAQSKIKTDYRFCGESVVRMPSVLQMASAISVNCHSLSWRIAGGGGNHPEFCKENVFLDETNGNILLLKLDIILPWSKPWFERKS